MKKTTTPKPPLSPPDTFGTTRAIDHLTLTVKSIDTAIRFYTTLVGMNLVRSEGGRLGLQFGRQQIVLVKHDPAAKLAAKHARPGSAQLCLVTALPVEQLAEMFEENKIPLEGPVYREGAMGMVRSILLHDPEGNLIELCNYAD